MSDRPPPSKAPTGKIVVPPKTSISGQHPAVQEYRRKMESIAEGVGAVVDELDQKLSAFLSDMQSSRPPPSDAHETEEAQTFSFIVVLSGVSEISEELERRLFDAGCSDALIVSSNGVVALDFDRQDVSADHAKLSAGEDVLRAGYSIAKIVDVSPRSSTHALKTMP